MGIMIRPVRPLRTDTFVFGIQIRDSHGGHRGNVPDAFQRYSVLFTDSTFVQRLLDREEVLVVGVMRFAGPFGLDVVEGAEQPGETNSGATGSA